MTISIDPLGRGEVRDDHQVLIIGKGRGEG